MTIFLLQVVPGMIPAMFCISPSRFLFRPYDATTTSNLLFTHSFLQFQLKFVRDVVFRSKCIVFFCSFAWLNIWTYLHTWLTSLWKVTSSLQYWLFFTLIQRDKVNWMCVTLNEGYSGATNRDSNNIQIRNQNISSQLSMIRLIFLRFKKNCQFKTFLRTFSNSEFIVRL